MPRPSLRKIQLRQRARLAVLVKAHKKQQRSNGGNEQVREFEELGSNEVEVMEGVPVDIVPICIICCCPSHNCKYPTKVKFLLGQVVPYSLLCDSTFRQEEIEQHIDLCSSCVRLLGQGEQLHERIVKLERELDQVKNTVKKFVQNSTLVKHEDGGNLVVEQIYVNIREQLLSDFVGEEDEENFVVTDYWSGVEFAENEERTENIFRTEHGNDPLEFEGDSIVEVVSNSDVANSPVSSNTRIEEDYRNFPDFERIKRSQENVSKIPTVSKSRSTSHKTGVDHLTSRNTGVKSNLPSFIEPMSLPVPEVRKLPDPTKPAKGSYPCAICPDKLDTLLEAILHRKFIHPGLSVCTSPVLTLQCGKIFRSCDIKRHRIESHPLVRCLECRESFTTTDRLESHMKAVHYKDGSALPPLPEFGYDVKLIPWVIPMMKEEVQEATRDQGFFRVNLNRVEIKDAPEQRSIDQIVDKVGPSTSKSQTTEECNKVPKILESGTASVAENIHITETARVFPTELTQVPVKPKKKKIIYNCGVCNTKFLVQSDLLQHLADAHNQTPKFGCIVCLKEFAFRVAAGNGSGTRYQHTRTIFAGTRYLRVAGTTRTGNG